MSNIDGREDFVQVSPVPEQRIRAVNQRPAAEQADYVLYWMTSARRLGWNFALQRAVEWSVRLSRPLVVLEALRCDYRWASDRIHRFVLDGMAEHAAAVRPGGPVVYYPYVEREVGDGRGLLEALARRACVVVGDDYPTFFLPAMLAAAGRKLSVRLEAVDSNGLLPMRAADRTYPSAYAFRRFLQTALPPHLESPPVESPLGLMPPGLKARVPGEVENRWPECRDDLVTARLDAGALPIDHAVPPAQASGGSRAARGRLGTFLESRFAAYAEDRNHPDEDATSGLSPYLHFGHLSVHEILAAVALQEDWSPGRLSGRANGKRRGWWGMGESAEAFLDELVTWRELGFNMAALRDDHAEYRSLPEWARNTLEEHAADSRPYLYALQELEQARTHDRLWNSAQRQLLREGRIHNYLRMLWGKKILEWSPSPAEAARTMIALNDRHALDGRDPNSYTGIFWCLGRYDRPWGPVRPIFGKIRYMSSENTQRKLRVQEYIERYGE